MRRTKEEAEKTREAIINAAISVFNRKGYLSSTIEDVAAEADVTRGAVYHYFDSKVDLFIAIRRDNVKLMNAIILSNIEENGKNMETLRRVFVEFFEKFENDRHFREIHQLVYRTEVAGYFRENKDFGVEFELDMKSSIMHIIDVIKFEQKAGHINKKVKPVETAWAFVGMFFGITNLWLINNNLFSIKRKGKALIEKMISDLLK